MVAASGRATSINASTTTSTLPFTTVSSSDRSVITPSSRNMAAWASQAKPSLTRSTSTVTWRRWLATIMPAR